jgi:1-acyl-sn-glycerol-3-phosphate acyltransferase
MAVRTPVLDVFRPAVHSVSRLYFGIRFAGVEHIPADGPLVITPNHQTFADPPLVTIPVRRRIHYMAWDRLFDVRGLAWLIRRLRAFPVDIEARDSRATREAMRILTSGAALMIFPEAERSADGRLQPFRPGAFRLAVSAGAPVLPVTIAGGWEAWPPGRLLPRPGRITITYHPPLRSDPSLEPRDAARDLAARTRRTIESALAAPTI